MVSIAVAATLNWGCAGTQSKAKRPSGPPVPLLTATKQDLIARYNSQAEAITSLNAGVTMTLTAGSAYTGLIKQYHEISGYILAQKPASIRVIGQAPVVGTNIFDMESDGEMFHIFVPSQNKFISGPTNMARPSAKPIENLRPQHLIGAIFWRPIPAQDLVLLEEASEGASHYYVITEARPASGTGSAAASDWEIARKIWFDRSHLSVTRIETYEAGGKLGSDIRYTGWDTFGTEKYPRQIALERPGDDYQLQIGITKIAFNEAIAADRFVLRQPAGTELVNVGDESQGTKPQEQRP